MAKYKINGGEYAVDDTIQGEELNTTLTQLADYTAKQNQKKFLDFLGKAEGGEYDLIVGGKQRFTDYTSHPNVVGLRTKEGPSTAAGKYQITGTTYRDIAAAAGTNDFSPESQDKMALALIARRGAADDVTSGNFNAAIAKLGKEWASLPSSPYTQNKRSQAWVDQALSQSPTAPSEPVQQGSYGKIIKNNDQSTLSTNPDWLRASRQIWHMGQNKSAQFTGTDEDLAEEGKSMMGFFNNNLVAMTGRANDIISHGTQEDKEAFLYMMDQYDENNVSWAGVGRAGLGMVTDPLNVIGLGTLGVATAGKIAATQAAKTALRQALLKSLGRTGIQAGILGGIQGGVVNTVKQNVEVAGGRKESVGLGELAGSVGVGVVGGVVLGTAGDALLTAAVPIAKAAAGKIGTLFGKSPPVTPVIPPVPVGNTTVPAGSPLANAVVGPPVVPPAVAPTAPPSGVFTGDFRGLDSSSQPNGPEYPNLLDRTLYIGKDGERYTLIFNPENHAITALDKNGLVVGELEPAPLRGYEIKEGVPSQTSSMFVEPTYQRKGINTAMHRLASEKVPGFQWESNMFTEEGRAWFDSAKGLEGVPTPPTAAQNTPGGTPLAPPVDPTVSQPITTTLLADEIPDATGARGQKGRLWTDDLPVETPINQHHTDQLDIPESAGGLRATERNMAQLTIDGQKVAAQLRDLDDVALRHTLEDLRSRTSLKDAPTIFRAVQILHDEGRVALVAILRKIHSAPVGSDLTDLIAQQVALESRLIHIQLADDAMGSFGGSINRQRLEGLVGMQGSTVDSLMRDMGLNKAQAEQFWADMIEGAQVSNKAKHLGSEYDDLIQKAIDAGDTVEMARLAVMKQMEIAGIAEEAAPGGAAWHIQLTSVNPAAATPGVPQGTPSGVPPVGGTVPPATPGLPSTALPTPQAPIGATARMHSFAAGLKELIISNLFTIKTVLINFFPAAIKTLTIPTAKYLVGNPLEKAARAELGAHYAAMGSTFRGALSYAQMAFRYEQSILTRGHNSILEGEMVMTGKIGGGLRFFPRMLNATDELLGQINYAGMVAGKAAHTAAIDGTAKGLTGKALDTFIDAEVTAAKAAMYAAPSVDMIQPIINKGVNLGHSGNELVQYVMQEAARNPSALRLGNDMEAIELVKDILYKRAFSGKGGASQAAKSYETFVNKNPSAALIVGQLFFRTPIRVFEEGIRMTPGVQILAPGFIKDLTGVNGKLRQVRAQGESLVGLGITGAALTLFSAGNITGSGVYNNYKQDKTRKDGPAPEPYTVKMSDGSTWSYKGMDPLSTSLRIIVNAFEGFDKLKIQEAQEQFENKPAYRLIQARMMVGVMALTSAIADANLVSGLKGTIDLVAELADPVKKEDALLKKVGAQLAMLVPNTFHKMAQMNDPRMRDPATFFQIIEARLGHGLYDTDENKSSFAYDALGQIRTAADTGAMYNIFSFSTQEERSRGNSEAHQLVMLEFDRLAKETGAIFTAPTPKNPLTGDLDLRTMMTKDGKETMFDRWQGNYRALNPDQILLPIAQSEAPTGTFKEKGMKVEMLQTTIKSLQDAAFAQLLTDERIRERLILTAKQKARAEGGLLDISR